MTRSTFGRPALIALVCLAALLSFAPNASAQYPGYCSETCPYDSCDSSCEQCVLFGVDYCAQSQWTTCRDAGYCPACTVTNRWTETQNYKYGPEDLGWYYCIGRDYWWGHTNWSQYQRYTTETVRITYESQTCNGVSSTREVSRTSTYGECYEFVNGSCFSGQVRESFRINGRECTF